MGTLTDLVFLEHLSKKYLAYPALIQPVDHPALHKAHMPVPGLGQRLVYLGGTV